jgi:hypothetical protein
MAASVLALLLFSLLIEKGRKLPAKCFYVPHFTLPDNQDRPARLLEGALHLMVALHIATKLLIPKCAVRRGTFSSRAVMAMPETSMDENNLSVLREYNIRLPGEVFSVESETESLPM